MAAKPVDRIRSMITELERGARTLSDDIRKRAGSVVVTSDLEKAIRQLMTGLTSIASQLEKAAGELRRFLEDGARAKPARAGKKSGKKARKKAGKKAKAVRKPAGKSTKKTSAKKAAGKKAPARRKAAKKKSR